MKFRYLYYSSFYFGLYMNFIHAPDPNPQQISTSNDSVNIDRVTFEEIPDLNSFIHPKSSRLFREQIEQKFIENRNYKYDWPSLGNININNRYVWAFLCATLWRKSQDPDADPWLMCDVQQVTSFQIVFEIVDSRNRRAKLLKCKCQLYRSSLPADLFFVTAAERDTEYFIFEKIASQKVRIIDFLAGIPGPSDNSVSASSPPSVNS